MRAERVSVLPHAVATFAGGTGVGDDFKARTPRGPTQGASEMSPSRAPRPRRSFIFTPGLRPDMFPKALASGADIVCVELEDGIAPKDKAEARRLSMVHC